MENVENEDVYELWTKVRSDWYLDYQERKGAYHQRGFKNLGVEANIKTCAEVKGPRLYLKISFVAIDRARNSHPILHRAI